MDTLGEGDSEVNKEIDVTIGTLAVKQQLESCAQSDNNGEFSGSDEQVGVVHQLAAGALSGHLGGGLSVPHAAAGRAFPKHKKKKKKVSNIETSGTDTCGPTADFAACASLTCKADEAGTVVSESESETSDRGSCGSGSSDGSSCSGSRIGSGGKLESALAKCSSSFADFWLAFIGRADRGELVASAKVLLSLPHMKIDHFRFGYDGIDGLSGRALNESLLVCFCKLVVVMQHQLQKNKESKQQQLQPGG